MWKWWSFQSVVGSILTRTSKPVLVDTSAKPGKGTTLMEAR